jgi:hypothetical protein
MEPDGVPVTLGRVHATSVAFPGPKTNATKVACTDQQEVGNENLRFLLFTAAGFAQDFSAAGANSAIRATGAESGTDISGGIRV